MKKAVAALGIAAAGVAAAGGATVHAMSTHHDVALTTEAAPLVGDADGWHYVYDMGAAELVQSPARSQFAWQIPVTFTKGDETISGDDYWRDSDGQANSVFISDHGAYYATDHDPLPFPQWTPSIFYSPNGYDDLTDSNAKLGDWVLGSGGSWMVRPADYRDPITFGTALDKTDSQMSSLFDMAHGGSGDWSHTLGAVQPVVGFQGLPMWAGTATFTDGTTTLTGTDYMWAPFTLGSYAQVFDADTGATYAYTPGFLGFDNMYYNPGDGGAVVDMMKTPLGNLDLSWLSWLFTPPDYTHAADALPDAAPFDGGDLTAALNFADGLPPAVAGAVSAVPDALTASLPDLVG